jgi:hypothetical protein
MSYIKDQDVDPALEPVFIETLAAAAHASPTAVVADMRSVQEMTDLHRVETFLELTAP